MNRQSFSLLLCAALWTLPLVHQAHAFKEAMNRPYVQSGPGGIFYARCIPSADSGTAGTTEIFRVKADHDERLDHYDWFTKHGVFLGWSPIKGQVAVMALQQEPADSPEKRVEFSFYLGGAHLRTWTTADLERLGAEVEARVSRMEKRATYRVLGCEQIPGTNEYVFEIELSNHTKLSFDILTGDLRKP